MQGWFFWIHLVIHWRKCSSCWMCFKANILILTYPLGWKNKLCVSVFMFIYTHRSIDMANTSSSTQQLWSEHRATALWLYKGAMGSAFLGTWEKHQPGEHLEKDLQHTATGGDKNKQTNKPQQPLNTKSWILALGFFSLNIDFWNRTKFDLCHVSVSFLPHAKWQQRHLFC